MTKKQLKNMAKTGGKYTLKGVKLLGRGALTVTELGAKATGTVAKGVAHNYDVRKYVEKSGYASILNPVIGVYDTPDEIEFSVLPQQFVLKDSL